MAKNKGALIGMIADEDTVTGLLLAGVGHIDQKRKNNFLIVDKSEFHCFPQILRFINLKINLNK